MCGNKIASNACLLAIEVCKLCTQFYNFSSEFANKMSVHLVAS